MTGGADVFQPSLAIATRAGEAELHGASHLVDAAGAIALRAHRGGTADGAAAIAGGANFLARDIEAHLSTTDGLPEVDVESVFEIGTLLRTASASRLAAMAAEE